MAEGQSLGAAGRAGDRAGRGRCARAADGSLRLDYPMVADAAAAVYGFHLANPGVYPFSLRILAADGDTVASDLVTQLIRLPAERRRSDPRRSPAGGGAGRPVRRGGEPPPRPAPPPRAGDAVRASTAETAALARSTRTVPVAVAPVPETIDTLAEHRPHHRAPTGGDLADAIGHRTGRAVGTYVPLRQRCLGGPRAGRRLRPPAARPATPTLDAQLGTDADRRDRGAPTPPRRPTSLTAGYGPRRARWSWCPSGRLAGHDHRARPTPAAHPVVRPGRRRRPDAPGGADRLRPRGPADRPAPIRSWPPTGCWPRWPWSRSTAAGRQACVRQRGPGLPPRPRPGAARRRGHAPARAAGVLLAALADPTAAPARPPPRPVEPIGVGAVTGQRSRLEPSIPPRPATAPPARPTPTSCATSTPSRWPASAPTPPDFRRRRPPTSTSFRLADGRGTGQHRPGMAPDLATSWSKLVLASGAVAAPPSPAQRLPRPASRPTCSGQLEPDHRAEPADRDADLGLGPDPVQHLQRPRLPGPGAARLPEPEAALRRTATSRS